MQRTLNDSLKKVFRPEFLNRVDATIVFRALSKPEISQIVDLEVNKVAGRVLEHRIKIELTPEARDLLADMGYDPDMGARPLRRVIQAKLEDTLSDGMLAGQFNDGDAVRVEVQGKDIKLVDIPGGGLPLAVPVEPEDPEAEVVLPAL
jgi:ATP-dependent Clp protease ATP-binding subunit ClpC